MDIFVSENEIKRMTNETSKDGQCRVLKNFWKLPFRPSPRGWPLVLKSDVEKTMGINRILTNAAPANDGTRIDEPNFESIGK